jgi:pSer/pThr/pTyr-binding forkhead associated (FHA) protein
LEDNSISRVHAEISIVGGKYVFKDISKNGSTLNGEYINNRSVQVSPGAPIM